MTRRRCSGHVTVTRRRWWGRLREVEIPCPDEAAYVVDVDNVSGGRRCDWCRSADLPETWQLIACPHHTWTVLDGYCCPMVRDIRRLPVPCPDCTAGLVAGVECAGCDGTGLVGATTTHHTA